MVHLIIGWGEVGKALGEILGVCYRYDRNSSAMDLAAVLIAPIDIMHICIPYTKGFEKTVKYWKKEFPKALVIVHSTVPVGTCDRLGVVHSFVTGKHPNLEGGIRTFTKYFGGKDSKKAAKIFSDLGIKTKIYKEARTSEAMKLISTTYYGLNIMIEKEIYAWCKKNNLPFKEIYSENNTDYNRGYLELGNPEFIRPNLRQVDGEISGHCIIPNLELIKGFWLGNLLKKRNRIYGKI